MKSTLKSGVNATLKLIIIIITTTIIIMIVVSITKCLNLIGS